MNDFAFQQRSPNDAPSSRRVRNASEVFFDLGWEFVDGCIIVSVALLALDRAHVRFAQQRRRLGQRVEHRLQIEGRSADDLEYVGGGGLLLERFRQFARRSEEHTSELQSLRHLVCRLLLEKKHKIMT